MIEASVNGWFIWLSLIALSTWLGISVARLIAWTPSAKAAGFTLATGCILAPFFLGIYAVLALGVLSGASHQTHLTFVLAAMTICAIAVRCISLKEPSISPTKKGQKPLGFWLLLGILGVWVFGLLVNAIFLPLMQNDPLEYATVGRLLYETRSLETYPVIDPQSSASGFYGPWTHPPLYVALIYLSQVAQGHAAAPGLMQLIAPWFTLAALGGIIALGRLYSERVGLIAGILFISAPLLFLSAYSALIDALPICGMVLLMLMLVGVKVSIQRGLWLGLGLGLALWAHSQSVLFIPIVLVGALLWCGFVNWRYYIRELCGVVLVAVVVAGWPYIRNFNIFGSPISDNPLVFASSILDWSNYFKYSRGIDNWPAIVQYGVLKGWFSIESYGVVFWIISFGLIAGSTHRYISGAEIGDFGRNGIQQSGKKSSVFLAILIVGIYLGGVIASILIGTDLMIRNDRYILVIFPAVAIGAAYYINSALRYLSFYRLQDQSVALWKKDAALLCLWLGVVAISVQFLYIGIYQSWRHVPILFTKEDAENNNEIDQTKSRFKKILELGPSYRAVLEMENHVPQGEIVFSLRPADMYYSKRKMLSYLDPRMLPVYDAQSTEQAVLLLKHLGVQYFHVPDYTLPPFYNSAIEKIIADPRLARLEYSYGTTQIYSLSDSGLRLGEGVDFTPGTMGWTRTPTSRWLNGAILGVLGLGSEPFNGQVSRSSFSLFHKDYSVLLASGSGAHLNWAGGKATFPVRPGAEYIMNLNLRGKGYVRLWIMEYDERGHPGETALSKGRPLRLGELALSDDSKNKTFLRRFKMSPYTKSVRIGVEHLGKSSVEINQALLTELVTQKSSD